jgi:hypothetical protein
MMRKFLFLTCVMVSLWTTIQAQNLPRENRHHSFAFEGVKRSLLFTTDDFSSSLLKYPGIEYRLVHQDIIDVLAKLIAVSKGRVRAIADTFSNKHNDWNWNIEEGPLPRDFIGLTKITGGIAITVVDYEKLQHSTNLFVASHLLHEMVHAYLTLYYRWNSFDARNDYPEIQTAWNRGQTTNYNLLQHKVMEHYFLNDMAATLRAFSESLHMDVSEEVFFDLAWGGLDISHNSWLSETDKERILCRLAAELTDGICGDTSPVGKALAKIEK